MCAQYCTPNVIPQKCVFNFCNMKKGLLLKPGPGPWTRALKNLDPEKPGKTWTLKNLDSKKLDSEKPGP